ncbi:hypothetical protein FIBSPDRAFT_740534 [Athelia psychrophila]|uniref:CENP-V/GFA domain-containing protein n=1 Tax=Athelia psychrophila TaxID=1759441 RepID=A0A166K2U9_9AGAM|nr:hypothetical protein FIBSPDRAFT_759340 [Fibularhizoctonia sp. CBS 109695]KZP21468.1 hypothetical protein FIBSPDRAFT_740534 [Fibularhizoctonia sp. CBS 109695]
MPVELKGSCHCGKVRFTIESNTPVPYQLCVCSICRKTGGYGGAINLSANTDTLKVEGAQYVRKYKAIMDRDTPHASTAASERNFCGECSAMLWLFDAQWAEWTYPFASAIDSELQPAKELTIVRLDSKPAHVRLPEGKKVVYDAYGPLSVADWHKEHGLWVD